MSKKTISVIKRTSDERRVVYAEVYAPMVLDSDNEYMTAEDIRKMAYNFMRKGATQSVDVEHSFNTDNQAAVVESFIAEGIEPFIDGSWVVGVHIPDDDLWELVKSGELNGFSMAGLAVKEENTIIEMEVPSVIKGDTLEDKSTNHTHTYEIRFSDSGEFLGGATNEVDGHTHNIVHHTITEKADGHTHRFSFLEALDNAED